MALNKMELIKCDDYLTYIDLKDVIDIVKTDAKKYTIIFNDGVMLKDVFITKALYNKFLNQKHIDKKSRMWYIIYVRQNNININYSLSFDINKLYVSFFSLYK